MGFTKLDERIIFSSIMGEDDSVFRIWIVILATCKQDGICPISSVFLSKITNKCSTEIERCLKILESPDPLSRTLDFEGRRIERVKGGFKVLNYEKYREFTYSDNPEATRKRKYREKNDLGQNGTLVGHSASASDLINSPNFLNSLDLNIKDRNNIPPNFESVQTFIRDNKYPVDATKWFAHYQSNGWVVGTAKAKMKDWHAAIRTWLPEGWKPALKPQKEVEPVEGYAGADDLANLKKMTAKIGIRI